MDNGFYNDYEERLLNSGNGKEIENEPEEEREKSEAEEYYELPLALKSRSLIWSVVSFVLGALSLALCLFYYVGIPFAIAGLIFSMVSRRNLGFFEKYSIVGLVLGLMGAVAGVFCLVANTIGLI